MSAIWRKLCSPGARPVHLLGWVFMVPVLTGALVVGIASAAGAAAIHQPGNISPPANTYYIGDQPRCSDTGPGTSPSLPWCDFTPVNSLTFQPGTHILLQRGNTWDQELDLSSSGSAGRPIVIGAYGTGTRPSIIRDGHNGYGALQRAMFLSNPSYVTVRDLSVGNAEVGIEAYYTTLGARSLTFSNIATRDIHGISQANMPTVYPPSPDCNGVDSHTFPGVYTSSGIIITGPSTLTFSSTQHAVSDVHVDQVSGLRDDDTFATEFCNGISDSSGGSGANLVDGMTIRGLTAGPNVSGGPVPGCMDGLHIFNSSHVLVTQSTMTDQGSCSTPSGTTAVILERDNDLTISHCNISGTASTGSPDESSIDLEYHLSDIDIIYSEISNNPGPGIEFQSFRAGDFLTSVNIEHNVFKNDGYAGVQPYVGSILVNGSAFEPTGLVEDNQYSAQSGLITGSPDPDLIARDNHPIQ